LSLVGKQLGGEFEIVEALGNGATSVVYKAIRLSDSQPVVVKLLHAYLVEKEDTRKRFEQEALAVTLLAHPNIVKVHALKNTPEGQPFMVLDYIAGTSMAEMIGELRNNHALAWKLFSQIADAMSHAHSHGVVHRGLKPGNIIVAGENAYVTDFGLAKLLPSSGQDIQKLTARGAVIGTPLFMSPEQCLGREIDERSDIYSFGCLMYACLTGKPPFRSEHILDTMSKHVGEMPLRLQVLAPELNISREAEAIVLKCLAKRPEERYQTMEALKEDMLHLEQSETIKATVRAPFAAETKTNKNKENKENKENKDNRENKNYRENKDNIDEHFLRKWLAIFLVTAGALILYVIWRSPQYKDPDEVQLGKPQKTTRKTLHPISSLTLLKQADELSLLNKDTQAQTLYREVILKAANRNHEQSLIDNEVLSTAHFGLANIFMRASHWEEAEKEMRMALYVQRFCKDAAPGKQRLELGLANCLMHQGKLGESKNVLLPLAKQADDAQLKGRAELMLADLARVAKHPGEAQQHELKAMEILKGQKGVARREYATILARYTDDCLDKQEFKQCLDRLHAAINELSSESVPPASKSSDWDKYDRSLALFCTCEIARVLSATKNFDQAIKECQNMQGNLKAENLEQQLRQLESPSPDNELLKQCEAALLALWGKSAAAENLLSGATISVEHGRLGRLALVARIKLYEKDAPAALQILAPFESQAVAQTSSHAEYISLTALVKMQEGKSTEALSDIDNAIALLRQTNDEALHLYCLRVKCQILKSLKRTEAADLIEKRIGTGQKASAAFDFLLPAYTLSN